MDGLISGAQFLLSRDNVVLRTRNGPPGEIRTPDQVVRSHLLYPAELRADIS